MEDSNLSYISAGSFPIKLLQNKILENGRLNVYHVQLYPTNICNLNCEFCSCANRNKSDVLPFHDVMTIMEQAKACGCKAMTISGGGEPAMHPEINAIIGTVKGLGISVGMATNGLAIDNFTPEIMDSCVTWCRISHSDYRDWDIKYQAKLLSMIKACPNVDWGISYVVTKDLDLPMISDVIKFSNKHNLTHVRLVSDLLDLESIREMEVIKSYMRKHNVDDSRVVYQGRKAYTRGTKKCLISLLKPVINADGKIYPCCGVQYASEDPSLSCGKEMVMGNAFDLKEIYDHQIYFDGSICDRCYYDEYNVMLNKMTQKISHREFV